MPNLRRFYGYTLKSEIPLPGLAEAPAESPVDILLERGAVPRSLETVDWSSPFIDVSGDQALLRFADGRLRFLVEGAGRVRADAPADAEPAEVETFLCGAVAGVILHRRRQLPLHAACMALAGRAVALVGPAGRGKSTLAAALAAAGWTQVADDVCRILFHEDGVRVTPGPPRLRLWPDAVAQLGGDAETLGRGRPDHPKRLLPAAAAAETPVRLAAVIRLAVDSRLEAPLLERLTGPQAVLPMAELLYRGRLGRQLGNREELFKGLMRLAGATPMWRLTRGGRGGEPFDLVPVVRRVLEESP